jgi:hypothetical protein
MKAKEIRITIEDVIQNGEKLGINRANVDNEQFSRNVEVEL